MTEPQQGVLEGVTGFEGPEKRLEVDFKRNPNRPNGLRQIEKEQWQEMLNHAKCTIISQTKNDHFDSYVLSESSLFVFPFKMMLKTCGTTTLLNAIPKLMEFAQTLDLEVDLVMFSRKNFLFPQKQQFPHINWEAEVAYLNSIFDGSAYVLGPLTQDHWFLYLADYSENARRSTPEHTMEIMMHDLDRVSAKQFYRKEGTADNDKFPGIADLIPGSDTDEFNFQPCGYSMNGLNRDVYYTIHVTPEPHCSYASFETNVSMTSYGTLVVDVLSVFRPGSFTLTLFCEKNPSDEAPENSLDLDLPGYVLKHKTLSALDGNCEVTLCNYESIERANVTTGKVPPHNPNHPLFA